MPDDFQYDLFLSHSSKDKSVVRELAERLRADGLRIWLDDWEIRPGDSIPAKIEEGLERSRTLVLCMSANSFGSEWGQLESGTFRFRDPLNKERRLIPLRLDNATIKGSLAQFLYIRWRPEDYETEYPRLLDACRPPAIVKSEIATLPGQRAARDETGAPKVADDLVGREETEGMQSPVHLVGSLEGHTGAVYAVSFSPENNTLVSGSADKSIRVWDLQSRACLRTLHGHTGSVRDVVCGKSGSIYSASDDSTIRVWSVATGALVGILTGHSDKVFSLALAADERTLVSGSADGTMRLWDLREMTCELVSDSLATWINTVVFAPDSRKVIAGTESGLMVVWDRVTGVMVASKRHTSWVWCLAMAEDGSRMVSGSGDCTVGIWETKGSLKAIAFLEGHSDKVAKVTIAPDGRRAASASVDSTVRVWNLDTSECQAVLKGHSGSVECVAISKSGRLLASGSKDKKIGLWTFSGQETAEPRASRYTNAKVLMVGDSGAGKTGLSKVIAGELWRPSDSTAGAWVTHWRLPTSLVDGIEREIWLWDFGGQADQRLIHQLYMEDTALAVLVFDPQKENLFDALGQWDRDLTRAARKEFSKLLVAGRVDVGGLRVSREAIEAFRKDRGYLEFLETSAKKNIGCDELKQAVLRGIRWEDIPWRSSPTLFKVLKEEIVQIKETGRTLMRFNELREALRLRLSGIAPPFTDEELRAVVNLLSGPGVVWQLKFGAWVLLQPETVNAYAQAVIQTMREDEYERGCLPEERVLNGDLTYNSSKKRLEADEERFVLLAMHQILVERGLCLREQTDRGPLLVFPSYYRRERPELVGHPTILVSYRFDGFLDDIYASLVVRLQHTEAFERDKLWRYAADFKTLSGKHLGIRLIRLGAGSGELQVYFEPAVTPEEKIVFSKYVHEHLRRTCGEVVRLRHYVCPHCGHPAGDREIAMKKLTQGKKDIPCVNCDDPAKRIPLWDQLEELFASPAIREQVRRLEKQSTIVLDNESKERALVGEVISTVALAGQLCREFSISDHGIDMEVEFKSDAGEATGRKVYLQLKSGDSYLSKRKRDGAEVFTIKNGRHVSYWADQAFPVILIIRSSSGQVRWMDVRDVLKRESGQGEKRVRQVVFNGQRFDVMSVRRWRDGALQQTV